MLESLELELSSASPKKLTSKPIRIPITNPEPSHHQHRCHEGSRHARVPRAVLEEKVGRSRVRRSNGHEADCRSALCPVNIECHIATVQGWFLLVQVGLEFIKWQVAGLLEDLHEDTQHDLVRLHLSMIWKLRRSARLLLGLRLLLSLLGVLVCPCFGFRFLFGFRFGATLLLGSLQRFHCLSRFPPQPTFRLGFHSITRRPGRCRLGRLKLVGSTTWRLFIFLIFFV